MSEEKHTMRAMTLTALAAGALGGALAAWAPDAAAWASANRFGGATQHSFGASAPSSCQLVNSRSWRSR